MEIMKLLTVIYLTISEVGKDNSHAKQNKTNANENKEQIII